LLDATDARARVRGHVARSARAVSDARQFSLGELERLQRGHALRVVLQVQCLVDGLPPSVEGRVLRELGAELVDGVRVVARDRGVRLGGACASVELVGQLEPLEPAREPIPDPLGVATRAPLGVVTDQDRLAERYALGQLPRCIDPFVPLRARRSRARPQPLNPGGLALLVVPHGSLSWPLRAWRRAGSRCRLVAGSYAMRGARPGRAVHAARANSSPTSRARRASRAPSPNQADSTRASSLRPRSWVMYSVTAL